MGDLSLELFPEKANRMRIQGLYADHGDLDQNSLQFWRRMMVAYCKHHRTLVVDTKDLNHFFTVDGIEPQSLSRCLEVMRHHDLIDKESIQRSYMYNIAVNSLTSLVSSYLFRIHSSQYICLPILKEIESLILKKTSNQNDIDSRVFFLSSSTTSNHHTFYTFQSFLKNLISTEDISNEEPTSLRSLLTNISFSDMNILIDYMVKNRTAIRNEENNMIKIISNQAGKSGSNPLLNIITDVEISKIKLKATIAQLQFLVEQCQQRISDIDQSLKSKIQRRVDRQLLLNELKIKKFFESATAKLQATLLSLLPVEEKLMTAEVNVLVTETYAACTKGLRSLRLQTGDVEATIDAYTDEVDLLDEAQALLTTGGADAFMSAGSFDDDELELEFTNLTLEAEPVGTTTVDPLLKEVISLPVPPTTIVNNIVADTREENEQRTGMVLEENVVIVEDIKMQEGEAV